VHADDVGEAAKQIVSLAEKHGGRIYASDITLTNDETAGGTITAKVPPRELEPMIADLASVGTVVSRSQDTDDVTDLVADLDRRVLSAQVSVDRIRDLMAETTDLQQLVYLETELANRQLVLEQLLGQRDGTLDRAALSTLTIDLRRTPPPSEEVVADTATEPVDEGPDEPLTIGGAFSKGWSGFVKVVTTLMVVIGLSAPYLVTIGVLVLLVRVISRRAARSRNRSTAPPHPPAPAEGRQTSEPDFEAAASSR
jgi:hypothetical protein